MPDPTPAPGPMPWPDARRAAGQTFAPLPARVVPLAAAAGAVLADDVAARSDLPATDVSAMDGWAVAGPPPWRVVGEVLAGRTGPRLAPSTAIAVATGATLPPGADGVLRQEWGRLDGVGSGDGDGPANGDGPGDGDGPANGSGDGPTNGPGDGLGGGYREGLVLSPTEGSPWQPGQGDQPLLGDVRAAGQECRAGEVVLAAGARIGPATLGLLAAAGHDVLPVRRATVAVLVLGDELLTSGPARDGRIRDALGPLLGAWLPAAGVSVVQITRVPDRRAALAAALAAAPADVVVTTGSTARGPVDHLHDVLDDAKARLVVDGVRVRPGHPMLLAELDDGRPLVGLPGNPLAAVSALLTLFQPLVDALHARPPRRPWSGVLTEDVSAGQEATRLIPVADGRPVLFAGPAMLRGLATADAVAVIPPGGRRAGEPVELLPLP